MTTGLPNDEKARIRQLFARARSGVPKLLEAESKSYHGPGTCTFYGTANSNQMLMEIMGLHTPGAFLRQPEHAAARGADPRGDEAGAVDHPTRQRIHAGRPDDRRTFDRQRHRRTERHRRLDQPHHPSDRHGGRCRHLDHLAGHVRYLRLRAAAGAGLSQRTGRREPFQRRRRPGFPHPRTARCRAAARGRAHGVGARA